MLKYKALWNNKTVILANQWFASSKTCHVCGTKNKDLMLHERDWTCPNCGEHLHRDTNAAINLVNYGINSLAERQVGLLENGDSFAASNTEYPTL